MPSFCRFYHYTADQFWMMSYDDYAHMHAYQREYERVERESLQGLKR